MLTGGRSPVARRRMRLHQMCVGEAGEAGEGRKGKGNSAIRACRIGQGSEELPLPSVGIPAPGGPFDGASQQMPSAHDALPSVFGPPLPLEVDFCQGLEWPEVERCLREAASYASRPQPAKHENRSWRQRPVCHRPGRTAPHLLGPRFEEQRETAASRFLPTKRCCIISKSTKAKASSSDSMPALKPRKRAECSLKDERIAGMRNLSSNFPTRVVTPLRMYGIRKPVLTVFIEIDLSKNVAREFSR